MRSASTPPNRPPTVQAHVLALFLARVEPRQPQQVANQPLHAERVTGDDLEEFAARTAPSAPPSSSAST